MISLGLDQALKTTGYSIYNNNKLISWGTINIKATLPIEQRLGTLWTHLNLLYKEYNFEHIFFEDTQKQTNAETYKKLCYVQAAVLLWCYYNGIKYTILSPSHWRSILKEKYKINFGRKREEQKQTALKWVSEKYECGENPFKEDEADAICIGAAGIIEYNKNKSAF